MDQGLPDAVEVGMQGLGKHGCGVPVAGAARRRGGITREANVRLGPRDSLGVTAVARRAGALPVIHIAEERLADQHLLVYRQLRY